mgnify:CR=1 FL=1
MKLQQFSQQTHDRLVGEGLDPQYVADIIRHTIAEDLDGGIDVTSVATVPFEQRSIATFGTRADGCVSGLVIAAAVVEMVCGPHASSIDYFHNDGERVHAGEVLMKVVAPTQLLLTAERTALNLLCHLSGIATATASWVDAVAGTGAIIRDTRKTTPGLRALEKYAVRCGGGQNHRMSLSSAALIKDNHIAAAGGVVEAFARVRALYPDSEIEIEVDTLDQLREVLSHKPDLVLLDNMSPAQCAEAVAIVNGVCKLEASGGISLENARVYAESGVDYIAIGALTHSAPVFDIGLDLRAE